MQRKVTFLFAPMEGISYCEFRALHHELVPGAAEYFTPSLRRTAKEALNRSI